MKKKFKDKLQEMYEIEDSRALKNFLKKYEKHFIDRESDNLPGKWIFEEYHSYDELQQLLFEFKNLKFKSKKYKKGDDIKKERV